MESERGATPPTARRMVRMADVVVVGGGTAGFAAAIAAARAGARVKLLEQSSYLGGTMTGGLVPGMVSLRHQPWRDQETLVGMETSYEGEQVVQGVAQELIDRLIDAGGAHGEKGKATIRVMFDPEIAKNVIDQMVREAGVETRYYTKVTDILRENGAASGAVTGVRANYGEELKADVVIDASGDGHVAWLAGARYEQGANGDVTYVQPITLYFLMGGVDLAKTIDYACSGREDFSEGYLRRLKELFAAGKPLTIPGFPRLREAAGQAGDYPSAFGSTTLNPRAHNNILRPIYRNGQTIFDTTMHNVDMAYRVDATDAKSFSDSIGSMRDFTLKMGEFYRKYVPGYENSYILQIADSVGVRETRRVVGEYMLTGEDVLEARSFADTIGYCGATVDVHNVNGSDKTHMASIRGGRLYQIPYRILVPESVDGLLVAGRCVSADRIACGSIRQQAGCMVTGQAAGVAAALAAKAGAKPRHVPVGAIQETLKQQGAQI
jgi:ribulose 1,5-bisphosphate synthetase/thiazole synthase